MSCLWKAKVSSFCLMMLREGISAIQYYLINFELFQALHEVHLATGHRGWLKDLSTKCTLMILQIHTYNVYFYYYILIAFVFL